jgi:hypothetical protein
VYAEHILESARITEPPVAVSDAARFVRGIRIHEEALLKDGYLIDFGDGEAEIIVNARAPRHRARFTAAHELGHWIVRMETDNVGDKQRDSVHDNPRVERWCDEFATALLMPAQWVRESVAKGGSIADPRVILDGPGRYRVSLEAYYGRLRELFGIAILECALDGVALKVRIRPSNVAEKSDLDAIEAFAVKQLGGLLSSTKAAQRVVGVARIPSVGKAVIVTGAPLDTPKTGVTTGTEVSR